MGSKRALIVDDSRSARIILKRRLLEYGVAVDEAASAEQAIELLRDNLPDAIFMDHMMPGMDGLQAVSMIKKDPRTAAIPVMMYTSKDGGEAYLELARSLGAIGVLPKELKNVDLTAVLNRLQLLEQRLDLVTAETGDNTDRPYQHSQEHIRQLASEAADEATLGLLKPLLETHTRRLEEALLRMQQRLQQPVSPAPTARPRRALPLLSGLLIGLLLGAGSISMLRQETPNAPPAASQSAATTAVAAEARRLRNQRDALLQNLEWALNRNNQFAPGSPPFNDQLLGTLEQLTRQMRDAGFDGSIELIPYSGAFCMVRNAEGQLELAADELPIAECDAFDSEQQRLQQGSQMESLAFASFARRTPLIENSRMQLLVRQARQLPLRATYPAADRELTAGEWNAAARLNQRVEIRLRP